MIKAQDYKDGDILAGIDGKPAKVVDVRVKEVPGFGDLPFLYIDINSKLNGSYIDEGYENIESGQVEVIMWLPKESADDDTKAKKVKGNNSMLSRLTKTEIDSEDEDAWMGLLEGGPLYEALQEHGETYVKCNGYNADKHNWQLEFNCDKAPKLTFAEFMAKKAKEKEAKKAAEKEKGDSPF